MANKTEYKKAIEASNGTRVDLSERLGITRGAVTLYLGKNKDMADLLELKRLSNIDLAESELFKQLNFSAGANAASAANIRQKARQFLLTRLGKSKGWVEKTEQEVEHKGIEQLKVIIEEKKPDGDKSSIKS